MAQRVITYVQFTDDLTGEPFAEGEGETIAYVLDGATYEIDLTEANAKTFRESLAPYLEVSRKTVDTRGRHLTVGGGKGTHPERVNRKPRRSQSYMDQVRKWAVENGYQNIPMTRGEGRMPDGVVASFEAANPALAWKG